MCKILPWLVSLSVALSRANFFSKVNTIMTESVTFSAFYCVLFWFSMLPVRQVVPEGMQTGILEISDSAITQNL